MRNSMLCANMASKPHSKDFNIFIPNQMNSRPSSGESNSASLRKGSLYSGNFSNLSSGFSRKTVLPQIRTGQTKSLNASSSKARRLPNDFRRGLRPPSKTADTPFLQNAVRQDCLKCLLKVRHQKCESHKYIRVGGGYRHGYWYVKALIERLELERKREEIRQRRLESIKESTVHAVGINIRTKSGKLVKKIVFLSEKDFKKFKEGGGGGEGGGDSSLVEEILRNYLSENEANTMESWDKDEVKPIKTKVRTKSGRTLEKIVYVNKDDYLLIQSGEKEAVKILSKYLSKQAKEEEEGGGGLEVTGWEEAKMKTIKAFIRTKSGRVIKKMVQISEDDYDEMIKEGEDPASIMNQYLKLEEGETLSDWSRVDPDKTITTKIRTKSGRVIEKSLVVSAEDYDKLKQAGGKDASLILGRYVSEGIGEIESWQKESAHSMKMIKTTVRTKSGRLLQREILMNDDEYKEFLDTGQSSVFLQRFADFNQGEIIQSWQKDDSLYSISSDEDNFKDAKSGEYICGKDGSLYEIVKDPLTGKSYKKKVRPDATVNPDDASAFVGPNNARPTNGRGRPDGRDHEGRDRHSVDSESESDFSYRSLVSAGGDRHVKRRRRRADGTRSDSESYHTSADDEGQARRRTRRRQRKHGPASAHSYYSEKSVGGTRHVKRRKRCVDGTYGTPESYESDDSALDGGLRGNRRQRRDKERRKRRQKRHGAESDHSYFSETSNGGTRHTRRRRRIRNKQGQIVGHSDVEDYCSSADSDRSEYKMISDGKGGKKKIKVGRSKRGARHPQQAGPTDGDQVDFSDASSSESGEEDGVDLDKMTEDELTEYLGRKAARKAEREMRRREKYGDQYEKILENHERKKKEKKLQQQQQQQRSRFEEQRSNKSVAKSMVTYASGSKRQILDPTKKSDNRRHGVSHDSWNKDGKRKAKEEEGGYDADSDENEIMSDRKGTKKKSKKLSGYKILREGDLEYVKDKNGRIVKKRKKKEDGTFETDSEYEYDEFGNKKKQRKRPSLAGSSTETSDGDYFEADDQGRTILKKGKEKIDLNKLSKSDLKKMGIDLGLSKQEIARKLKEKFGDSLKITSSGEKVATKKIEDYSSDVDTDHLADDSDLDVTTLSGVRRVNVMMRRGGQKMVDHLNLIMKNSQLDDQTSEYNLDEKDSCIDFLSHYRLVNPLNLPNYGRAFVVEDEDMDARINIKESSDAIQGVDSVKHMTAKQKEYVFKVLKIDEASQITFRMFAVITALSERVTQMDPLSKHLLEICDLLDIERKMDLYRGMFYFNADSDQNRNFIKTESLQIDLIAGGLNWKQQNHIMNRLRPNAMSEISFLDFICYIPLFMSMHDNIIDNPLDMSCNKYDNNMGKRRRMSGSSRQRDMNPLGIPLKKNSPYQLRQQAKDLLDGKIKPSDLEKQKKILLNKYAKLPDILS